MSYPSFVAENVVLMAENSRFRAALEEVVRLLGSIPIEPIPDIPEEMVTRFKQPCSVPAIAQAIGIAQHALNKTD